MSEPKVLLLLEMTEKSGGRLSLLIPMDGTRESFEPLYQKLSSTLQTLEDLFGFRAESVITTTSEKWESTSQYLQIEAVLRMDANAVVCEAL